MSRLLEGRTAIVSGALGDIGRAIALECAKQGAAVALGDVVDASHARDLLARLDALGARSHYTRADVSDPDAVRGWLDDVERHLGVADVVVANAATVTLARLHELTPGQWSRELRVNLDGAFYLAQGATARLLRERRRGHVVFLGSWAAHAPHAHIPAYCVSKAGLRMLCQCMAVELAPHGILVNEIAPGFVNGGVSRRVWEEQPALYEAAREKVPVKTLITPEEVAEQVVLVCDPRNRHMTGATVLMDGGLSLLR